MGGGAWGKSTGGVTRLRMLTDFCGTACCCTPWKAAVCEDEPRDDLRDVTNESAKQQMKIHLRSVFCDGL